MYFGCFDFRGEHCFLKCDDICMCVVNKQFELLEFVVESVYVDSHFYCWVCVLVWCLFSCGNPWSVCEVVVVPYVVGAVVALTVMHVLKFVLHVCMLREC